MPPPLCSTSTREGAALTLFLQRAFSLILSNCYDDRFVVTRLEHAEEERNLERNVCTLLGVTHRGDVVPLLGIRHNYAEGRLFLCDKRRTGALFPAESAKLKGSLRLCAPLLGPAWRAYLRQFARGRDTRCVQLWSGRSRCGSPSWTPGWTRALSSVTSRATRRTLIFTDGSYLDTRQWCQILVNHFASDGWRSAAAHGLALLSSYSDGAPQQVMESWLPRKTQISTVELRGAVLALDQLGPCLGGQRILVTVDSESVEASLLNGCSAGQDHSDLLALFWYFAMTHDVSSTWDGFRPTGIRRTA